MLVQMLTNMAARDISGRITHYQAMQLADVDGEDGTRLVERGMALQVGSESGNYGSALQTDELRFRNINNGLTDRSASLLTMQVGDRFTMTQNIQGTDEIWEFEVLAAPTSGGNHVVFPIVNRLSASGGFQAGLSTTVRGVRPGNDSITYQKMGNYWSSNQPSWAAVTGEFDNHETATTESYDAFGCDLTFQQAAIGDGWEVVALLSI